MNTLRVAVPAFFLACTLSGAAEPTWVGNGDPGADLEGVTAIKTGRIVNARKKAIELLKELRVKGVPGLGFLLPEVTESELFLANQDVQATLTSDQSKFHSDLKGRVYARTFARPHSATRFFPIAKSLNEDQLVALHIHEALHRALPEEVREDETIVSELTLAITGPDSSQDSIAEAASKQIPAEALLAQDRLRSSAASTETGDSTEVVKPVIPDRSRAKNPSTFGYSFRSFERPDRKSLYSANSMHTLESSMYPFGGPQPLGIGIEASLLNRETGSNMGPLGLSLRSRLWTLRGFDVEGWISSSVNMLSAEEFKNSPMGRDVHSLGLSMSRELPMAYFETSLSYSLAGTAKQEIALVKVDYEYGSVIHPAVRGGFRMWNLRIGGGLDIYLADYYRVKQGSAFNYDSGRLRFVSAGPEIAWRAESFGLSVEGRYLIDSTPGMNFDNLGNILATGVSDGSLKAGLHYYF